MKFSVNRYGSQASEYKPAAIKEQSTSNTVSESNLTDKSTINPRVVPSIPPSKTSELAFGTSTPTIPVTRVGRLPNWL
jgi:hypothetical protein